LIIELMAEGEKDVRHGRVLLKRIQTFKEQSRMLNLAANDEQRQTRPVDEVTEIRLNPL
jgi:hypothetical protein